MRTVRWIVAGIVAASLAGCGADEIESPGQAGNITINNPPPTNPDPTPNEPSGVEPAAGCPTIADSAGLTDAGTVTGPTGTYRVCTLPARFTANTTLARVPGLLYALNGRVDVGTDLGPTPTTGEASVVLTIQPGVVLFAQTGTSWLAVNRGNRIHAEGSATQPIVFTSRDNVLGISSDDSQGQWGGVVLMGRAPITDCRAADPDPNNSIAGTNACDRQTEGATDPALYGGEVTNDNSGTIKYVQIRYSGYVLSGDNELQSLTLEGVGSGTTIDYFQTHNSSDDGFENFGGRAHMRHVVITGADDDNIDLDTGYQGTIQYIIAVQKTSGNPDSMIELDSANTREYQTPRTHMKLANFTFVHRNSATGNQAAMLFRGGADTTLVNGVVTSPIACLRLHGANMLTSDPTTPGKVGPPVFQSVVMQCASPAFVGSNGLTADQVAGAFNAGSNNSSTFTATLNAYVNGANEAAAVATDPSTLDPAFQSTNYVGAVRAADDTWYAGWTCNSATADFGTNSTACTSLPSLAE